MIDHMTLHISDFVRSRDFYGKALASLGAREHMGDGQAYAGFGVDKPSFWIGLGQVGEPTHVAFAAPDRKTVDAFYAAAIAAGGRDNGGPGLRSHYHPNYYGAFVLDPDGHNIEAVCHRPE